MSHLSRLPHDPTSGIPRTPPRAVRVAFVIDRLDRAGTEIQLLALIRYLDRSRVLPWLILLDGDDETSRQLVPTDCPVVALGVRSLASGRAIRAACRLARCFRQWKIDVVQTYFFDSTLFGATVARCASVPWIIRVRNNLGYWRRGARSLLEQVMRRLVHRTLTNSRAGRDSLLAEGISADRIEVLENGVDVERFSADPPRLSGTIRVGAVANLRPVKGIDLLIRAAGELRHRHPQLSFEVAGEGPQRPELEHLIRQYGLEDRFHLRGSLTDIPRFLADLDIVVSSSRSESMSNALLEAMAAGRAIVATRVGDAGRLIRDGIDGRLIEPEDVSALVSAIDELVRQPEVGRSMGRSARQRVVTSYSREGMCRRFEQFYHDLVFSHARAVAASINSIEQFRDEPVAGVWSPPRDRCPSG